MAERIIDILERVGTDPKAATTELSAELFRPKPRRTLIRKLERIVVSADARVVPAGLVASTVLWDRVTQTYTLRPDELRILEDACREMDLIDRLQEEVQDGALIVEGSMGQPVTSPLVAEIRQHRLALRQLLATLKLPDEPAAGRVPRSVQARQAASARWTNGT